MSQKKQNITCIYLKLCNKSIDFFFFFFFELIFFKNQGIVKYVKQQTLVMKNPFKWYD